MLHSDNEYLFKSLFTLNQKKIEKKKSILKISTKVQFAFYGIIFLSLCILKAWKKKKILYIFPFVCRIGLVLSVRMKTMKASEKNFCVLQQRACCQFNCLISIIWIWIDYVDCLTQYLYMFYLERDLSSQVTG